MGSETLEYIIKQKTEGGVLLRKAALIIGYLVLFLILALVIILLSAPLLQLPFLLLDIAFCAMVAFISWRFVCIEYELIFSGGELNATVIYGKSVRRKGLSVTLNSLFEVGIYDDAAYEKLCSMSLQKNYIYVSSMSAEVIYYAIFDEGKDRCVLYFEADERAVKHIRLQNPSALRQGNIR